MARQKQAAPVRNSTSSTGSILVVNAPKPKAPGILYFVPLAALSLTLSAALYSAAANFTTGDLSTVSRSLDGWWEIAGLVGFKVAELGIGWWLGYDDIDVASLTFLSHLPQLYFLYTFYGIQLVTVIGCLLIDCFSTFVPFWLFRERSPVHHSRTAPANAVNHDHIIKDQVGRVFTSTFASAVYALTVFGSFFFGLPVFLVTHFDGLRDISAVRQTLFPLLLLAFIPMGVAAREFLFTPSIGALPDAYSDRVALFRPESATLAETIEWNLWGYSVRSRVLIKRTVVLALITGLHTWLQSFVAIDGADIDGALGWSALWVFASTAVGAALWWNGNVVD